MQSLALKPSSALAQKADAIFTRTSPYPGNGFRNHCIRLYHFATMLMERDGIEFDKELAYTIAMAHDLGIVSERDEGQNYLQRSRALFHREFEHDIPQTIDARVVDECLLFNHRLLPVPNLSREADCFRKAVIIEHSRGHIRFGLDPAPVRALFDNFPRDNFDRVLLDFGWRTIRREPLTIVHGIFF